MADKPTTPFPRLEGGVVHVFWIATDLPPAGLRLLEPLLSPAERARSDRYHFPRDRGRYVAARARLRLLLGHYSARAPMEVEFDTGPFGKPSLRPAHGAGHIQFNLSRSGGVGVIAIGLEDDLGIDVEHIRPFDHVLAIAERWFTAGEHRALVALTEDAQPTAFFRYWARKEALVKSLGRGLSYPLNQFELTPEGLSVEHVTVQCDGGTHSRSIVPVPALFDGFVAALSTAQMMPTVRCWSWPTD